MATDSISDASSLTRNAKSAVSALFKGAAAASANSECRRQLFESKQIYLTVATRSAAGGSHLLQLGHSPHGESDASGCLIVKDLARDPKDYEATGEHFKQELRACKCELDLTVLPLRELTVAYMPYEAKRSLCNSYDYFLADRRIAHRLGNKLGKQFSVKHKRKLPIPLDMEARDLKEELNRAARTVRLCINGTTSSCLVGHLDMSEESVLSNVLDACQQLHRRLATNLLGLYIRCASVGNVPLYHAGERATVGEGEGETVEAESAIDKDLETLRNSLWDPELVKVLKPAAKANSKAKSAAKVNSKAKAKPAAKRLKSSRKLKKSKKAAAAAAK